MTIHVVGLGPAGAELIDGATSDLLRRIPRRFVRTRRHPAAAVVEGESFDGAYEAAATLEQVYATIVERLLEAGAGGDVLYAVPGSPLVAERTVELLRGHDGVVVHPALSFLDLAWARLGVDPLAAGVRLVDGHRFAAEAAGERGPLLVAQCDSADVLSSVKLAVDEGPTVTVLQRLGLPDERVYEVAWDDLDRAVSADHLTSLWVPELAVPTGRELARFAGVVRELRERCPWDRAQTHQSLVRYLIEEAYEVVEAIEGLPASYAELEEELGDLLLQVFLHATLAAQAGEFTLAHVAQGITDKMIRRHPHVFGDLEVDSAAAVERNWEQLKAAEKATAPATSALHGVPGSLPALSYAWELGRKAAKVGFDWPAGDDGVWDKVQEELAELRAEPGSVEELGDVLFATVNLARHLGHEPESALRQAAAKFRRRFEEVERLAGARGVDMRAATLEQLDALWDEAKAAGGGR